MVRHSDGSDAFEHVSTMSAHCANLSDLENAPRHLSSLEVAVYAGFCSSGLLTVQRGTGVVQNNQQFTEDPLLPYRCSTSVELSSSTHQDLKHPSYSQLSCFEADKNKHYYYY